MLKAVAGYGMRSYEKAILKSTWNDDLLPHDDHIQYLIECTRGQKHHDIAGSIQAKIAARGPWKVGHFFKSLL